MGRGRSSTLGVSELNEHVIRAVQSLIEIVIGPMVMIKAYFAARKITGTTVLIA